MLSGPLPRGPWWKQDGEQREVELHCKCNRGLSQSYTELWSCLKGLTLQSSPRLGQQGWIIIHPPSIHRSMNVSYGWEGGVTLEKRFSSAESRSGRGISWNLRLPVLLPAGRASVFVLGGIWAVHQINPCPGTAPPVQLFSYWYQCPPFIHAVLASLFLSWDVIHVKQ